MLLMANYPTFIVVDCNTRKPVLTTSSARKANNLLTTGYRIEIWINNTLTQKIHASDKNKKPYPLMPYIQNEKEYIREKQKRAEQRNAFRKIQRIIRGKTG